MIMTHRKLKDENPSAIITVNGSEKKIYDGNKIYLKKNDNFEFRFFNPTNKKIGIEIIFNNQKRGSSMLVLNPGQDATIDRFLDNNRKMKFDTYEVDGGNEQAVKAIKNNGLVEIKFYKERDWVHYPYSSGTYTNTGGFYDYNSTTIIGGSYGNSNLTSGNAFYSANLDSTKSSKSRGVCLDSLETGRVEQGEESDQEFEYTNVNFDSYPFHTIKYEMKPESTMPKQSIRNYCTECGYRIRNNAWKYCPKCSNVIE